VTDLYWEGCANVRDLGGLPTDDGGRTRRGGIVRADNVRRLTDDGWRSLVEHGVRRVVDLRFPEELAEDPPSDSPVEVVHISLLGDARTEEWLDEFNEAMDNSPDAEAYLVWSYLEFLERFKRQFARVFDALATAPDDGPVVVHCMGGKDRTGIVSALMLRLAGVPYDAIGEDYAVTAANLEPSTSRWIPAIEDEAERAKWEKLRDTPAGAMIRVVEEIERRYGDVASYLRAAGLTNEQVDRLRERLVAA
jgi:protein-tyrosine phosphatase